MLIFKNNIYDKQEIDLTRCSLNPDSEYDTLFDPCHLIYVALDEESSILDFLGRQPSEYWSEDSKNFYPRSRKIGSHHIFSNLRCVLSDGLNNRASWYKMNTYHFCFLYDVLVRFTFNYNHDNAKERLKLLPEIKAKPLQIESFFKNYFFNTVFLIDPDKYNLLTREEKLEMGYNCPCQFAVINALAPTKKEMELESSKNYPYSIHV